MAYFGKFYLDKEKDMIVELELVGEDMSYTLTTPNHKTGNLITNLAKLCSLPLSYDRQGLKIIVGEVPCYYDGDNKKIYILRLGDTKVANIYPDGRIERRAYIPAIAKTLMSQTKDYVLDMNKTLVKTFIRREVKFHSDLHTHRSANLSPDVLIAIGIHHQLRYPYYYVKKLGLKLTNSQREEVELQRSIVAEEYRNSTLTGKYLDRKIDDNTEMNFASLILGNLDDAAYNISKIRASLAVMKDGQAVFTNLEKVYIYRYVFTKGTRAKTIYPLDHFEEIPDQDILNTLRQMNKDRENKYYKHNTLYQDELLWIARMYAQNGVRYAEISDTALVKPTDAAFTLEEIHGVMPAVTKETGVTLRFLAALRRIPLTIVKDDIATNYFTENLQVLKAVAKDPYVAGSDFVGEEMNDIRELAPVIKEIVGIAKDIPSYVLRIHAGENDSLPDNVLNSVLTVEEALAEGQFFPHMRLGHGLYTAELTSEKGKFLLSKLREHRVALEFQISSNVRLNNLSNLDDHPLKTYLKNNINCVQGTDGGALYGSNPIDEQLSLERMLELDFDEMKQMRKTEDTLITRSLIEFEEKKRAFEKVLGSKSVTEFYNERIQEISSLFTDIKPGSRRYDSNEVLAPKIKDLPLDKAPIVIVGGSFNNAEHVTVVDQEVTRLLDDIIAKTDPDKAFFVIGSTLTGYERYILDHAKEFDVFAFVPSVLTEEEKDKFNSVDVGIRVSIESSPLGVYKSFAYEIFKRRPSILLALDGNSAASNMIQDAKNSQYKCWTLVDERCQPLKQKAQSLEGYVTFFNEEADASIITNSLDKTII